MGLVAICCQYSYALEASYFKESTLDVPYREAGIILGDGGYFPNRIVVYKGEKIRFFVTSVTNDSGCFNIPDKNIFTSPNKNKIIEAEVFFDKVGIFQFNCPNNKLFGKIIVLEKASERDETKRRGLASDLVKVWRPKENPSEWVQIKRSDLGENYIDLDRERNEDLKPQNEKREMIGFERNMASE